MHCVHICGRYAPLKVKKLYLDGCIANRNQITIKTYQDDHNNTLNANKSFMFIIS